jgi:methionyl-tRNA formyltransferase
VRLAFAGTPSAAVPSLTALLDSPHHQVVAVITRPPKPAGRGRHEQRSPIHVRADEHSVPVLTPAKPGDPAFLAELAALEVDCCPVVAYGALLPATALQVPAHGWVNLHFSLLPAWRGAAPVQHAILRGDDLTGASTFQIETGLDTGPVFGVVTEAIWPTDTAGDLLERLSVSGAGLLLATMDGIADGTLRPQPQPGDGVSIAGKITVEDARLDWTWPAIHLDRQARACTPAPGPWTTFRDERLKLGPLSLTTESAAPGELVVQRQRVLVGTGTSAVALGLVQAPGKKPMPAADWARGARPQAGDRLG